MQPPLFDPDLPHYLTYGAFGSIAGHELSHAFDSLGRHYDANGNYTDWWTPSTVRAFESRARCFVEQYSHFNVSAPDGSRVPVNGWLTLGENIADAGGSAAAFAARAAARGRPGGAEEEADLPGLEGYSHDQLFFVSQATFFCGKISNEEAVRLVYTNPHAPDFARVLGTMANSRGFREAYNCPVKKPTCEIW
jgi:endothelin-converting enzyme